MNKKRYLVLLLILLLIPAATASWGFALPECYGESFMGELKYKVSRLDELDGRRIVIVGGSAAAFGVDSELLGEAFPDREIVNLGMYAALGTTVMLDLSEKSVREGDTVVIMPEISQQTLSDFFDPAVMWQGLDGAYGLISRLPSDKILRLFGAFPEFAASKLRFTLRGERPAGEGAYRRDVFNAYGDADTPLAFRNVMPLLWDETSPVEMSASMIDGSFIKRANEYAERTGADVVFALAPVNAMAVSGDIGELYDALCRELSFPVIGNARDSVMDAGWFFDTNYHLNSAGRVVFTDSLIGALKAHYGDPETFAVPLPNMPEPQSVAWTEGDDGDGAYFYYSDLGETWAISGAQDRETLTVPAHFDGRPVSAILEGAFSECKTLKEVTIQENIRSVASGAFDGAESLERIILKSEKPSSVRAGDGLLRGTSAKISVPDSAYGAYMTDYFWSVFSGRIE
ncbi:MAG: leucine-rich repeat protein [Oscillospiraceae bacterium]|nr:leucine-rich repeat protein [Oscillospiraceae bacterium]